MNPKLIRVIAQRAGYVVIDHQENIKMISFRKGDTRINIYYSKMTVATCIDHPVQGKTQLFRRNVGESLLVKIFQNPRVHTDIGYRRK